MALINYDYLKAKTKEDYMGYRNLKITTEKIKKAIDLGNDTLYQGDNLIKIKNAKDDREYREQELLKQRNKCKLLKPDGYEKFLNKLNVNKLKNLLNEQFYNKHLLKILLCFLQQVTFIGEDLDDLNSNSNSNQNRNDAMSMTDVRNQRIKNWLTELQSFNTQGINGYALSANFKDIEDLFAVKAPKNNQVDSQHELFVGLFGTNKLRETVPNFSYVFGGFSCTGPVIGTDNKIISWCYDGENIPYIVYENIQPNISLAKAIKTISGIDWLRYYMSILYALKAGQKIEFTHYDLHPENVLLREVQNKKEFYVPYETERGVTEYLLLNLLPVIIDYGYSHIKYNNEHFGIYELIPDGVYPDKPSIFNDAYKLLLFSMFNAINSNNQEIIDIISDIFLFFNDQDSIFDVIKDQRQFFYYLPLLPDLEKVSIDDFLHYIRLIIPEVSDFLHTSPQYDIDVLGCQGTDYCLTPAELKDQLNLDRKDISVETLETFFDLVDINRNKEIYKRPLLLNIIKDTFNFNKAGQHFLSTLNTLSTDLQKSSNITFYALSSTSDFFINQDKTNKYKSSVLSYVKTLESLTQYLEQLLYYAESSELLSRDILTVRSNLQQFLLQISLPSLFSSISSKYDQLYNDSLIVSDILSDTSYIDYYRKNYPTLFDWYSNQFNYIIQQVAVLYQEIISILDYILNIYLQSSIENYLNI